jgi:hypothetical protein
MSLKNHAELVAFFRGLATSLRSMPTATRIYKVVPALKSGIERSIGPDRRAEDCREVVSATLPVLSDIGSTMTSEEYVSHVLPAVLPLFSVKDRSVRLQLLERIDGLVRHMDSSTVNSIVFESLNAGFADTAKVLRELTLKSMLSLAGKLNEKNLNDTLMRTLNKLQADPEPSIRTNTTIFYGKIAPKLQDGIRVRIIVPAFLRAMKDPFPYARLAVRTRTGFGRVESFRASEFLRCGYCHNWLGLTRVCAHSRRSGQLRRARVTTSRSSSLARSCLKCAPSCSTSTDPCATLPRTALRRCSNRFGRIRPK